MRWVLFFLDELKFFHFVKLRLECFFQITQVAWSTTTCYYCQKRWRWRQEVVGGWWGCIFSNDLLSEQTYSHLIWIVSYLMETSWLQNCGFFDNVLLTLVMETQLLMSQPREIVLKNASLCELGAGKLLQNTEWVLLVEALIDRFCMKECFLHVGFLSTILKGCLDFSNFQNKEKGQNSDIFLNLEKWCCRVSYMYVKPPLVSKK